MTVQINNQSKRSLGLVVGSVAFVLSQYHVFGDDSAGAVYDGSLKVEWRTEDGVLIFTVTNL